MLNRDALDYLRCLPISAHALLPFEESSIRDQALVEYIRGATTQNRMILHLSADPDRDSRLLFGGSAKESVRDQIRILPVREVFAWPLSIEGSIAFLKTASEDALRLGFSGLAQSADATPALSEELLRLEEAMGRVPLIGSFTALCMYDARKLEDDVLIRLLSTHGHVIFPGIAGRLY